MIFKEHLRSRGGWKSVLRKDPYEKDLEVEGPSFIQVVVVD